jgi:iron complex outermembrane receptor protein
MSLAILLAAMLAAASLEASAQVTAPDATAAETPKPVGEEPAPPMLAPVTVTATKPVDATPTTIRLDEQDLASQRAAASDSARLLQDVPGVSINGAGGISSLPAIHGLGDDRVRVQVDGADVASSCPNHMNSPLSYISPSQVERATVFAGITPVSVGGNSIGGTIQLESAPPEFADAEGGILAKGRGGSFFRSNGRGVGYDFGASVAARGLSLSYRESTAQSDNYSAARPFKPSGPAAPLRGWLDGDEVGSSAYDGTTNRDIGLAVRRDDHLLQLKLGRQIVGFEGFPNQRMDMTSNENNLVNLGYTGTFSWGELEARAFGQNTRHAMNMGPDRFFYGFGMPMDSKAKTRGAQAKGSIQVSDRDLLRVGGDTLAYRLDDWWSPVGSSGSMCCNDFWNVRNGQQDRFGVYGEWEASWSPEWTSLLGVRGDLVRSDAGSVQGYNDTMQIWTADAAAFNARDRQRTDLHLDLTALLRYAPHAMVGFEGGYARKTRSPNLYERYVWSTNAMASLMNNFVGDGNGYVGNLDLKPEVAHTLSGSVDLHDADASVWGVKATGYVTRVHDFIDARRCDFGQCSKANATAADAFVFLQYVNQSALLYGVDVSAHWLLGRNDRFGSVTATGWLSYVRGENRKTDDDLYHIMPLNGKLALVHALGRWTNTVEFHVVDDKTRVSSVRNEVPTARYSLLNLRTSYEFEHVRLDLSVENVFNRFYSLPLGGAYLGQGLSMSSKTIPWGTSVPGAGRSINVALSVDF